MLNISSVPARFRKALQQVETLTQNQCAMSGFDRVRIDTEIIHQRPDYYWVRMILHVLDPGCEISKEMKFRMMKSDQRIVWAYHWL